MKQSLPFFKLILSFLLLTGTTLGAFAQVQELNAPVKAGVNRMTKFGEQLIAYEANGNKSIYKLDAATQQWVDISLPRILDIRAFHNLNVVAGQGDYLFAGFDINGIYRSDDQGESWLKTSNGIEEESIYAIEFHNDEIYVGTYSGIFKSSNDGISWTEFSTNFTSFQLNFRMIHFLDGYIYTATYNGLYSTQDNGTSWQSADAGLASTFEPNQMFEFSGLQFVAGFDDQEVLKLARRNDHVSNWEEATTDIALDTVEVINFEVIDNQLLALSDKGFFQYDLQNYSWTPITIDEAGYTTQQFFSDGQDFYRMTGFDVLHASLTDVWAGNETQIDWTRKNEGFAPLPVHDLLTFNDKLYAGTSNGVFETNTEEQPYDWHITSNKATEVKSLLHFDTLLLAASETNLYISSDSAQSWSSTLAQETFHVYAFEGNLYAATFEGVYISEDTAKTWYPSNIGLTSNEAYEFAAIGSTLFVQSWDDIFRSTDKGLIWEKLNVETKVNESYFGNPVSLSASTDQLFATFAGKYLVQSNDLGESWITVNDTEQIDYNTVQSSELSTAQQDLVVCVSAADNTLAFSLSNGQSWNQTPLNEVANRYALIHSLFIHEGSVYFSMDGQFYGFDTNASIIPAKPVLTEVALDKGMNDYSEPTKLNLRWEVDPEADQIVVKSHTSGSTDDIHYADASLGQDSVSYNSFHSKNLAVYAVKNNIYSEATIITPMEEWSFLYTHSYYDYSTNPETEKKYLRWGIATDYDTEEFITDTVQIFVSSDGFQTYAEGYEGYITNGANELESEIGEGNKADWLDVPGGMYEGKARYKKGIYYGGFTHFSFEAPERPQDQETDEPGVLGTDEFSTAQRIALYPNPTESNKLYLNMSGLDARQVEAEIFNSVGNKIRSKTLKSKGAQLSHTFELSELPAGVYFIKLSTNEHMDTIRFIKKD